MSLNHREKFKLKKKKKKQKKPKEGKLEDISYYICLFQSNKKWYENSLSTGKQFE